MCVGMRQVSPAVGLGCDCLSCFPSLAFPWTPHLSEFGREQTNCFDSILPKGRRVAGEEGLGLPTEVQNGLECCELGHWLLPPHKKAE